MRLVSAFVGAVVAFGLVACGDGKSRGEGREVVWVLNPAETLKRADSEQIAWTKKRLEGLNVVLALHANNDFDLTIEGGDKPEVSKGKYRGGSDAIFLVRQVVNGTTLPASTEQKLPATRTTIELTIGSLPAILTEKR